VTYSLLPPPWLFVVSRVFAHFFMFVRRAPMLPLRAVLAVLLLNAVHAQTINQVRQAVDTARVRPLPNHLPQWANASNDAGAVPADQTLSQMTVVLSRPAERQRAFESFLAEQQNPASPEYHHWLTASEAGERFGVSSKDLASVTQWLESQGLQVDWVSPSRIFVGFSGRAADVGRAFQTDVHTYTVNGAKRVSVRSDPMIPEALIPAIRAIRGLYTIEEHPLHSVASIDSISPLQTTSSGSHFIAPADFATIYNVPSGVSGAGQSIGILSQSRSNFADFDNFRMRTGSTFANPTEIVPTAFGAVDPGPAYTAPPGSGISTIEQSEANLDVTRAGSVAPSANLLLVIASASSGGIADSAQYLVQSSPVPAQVMSISYGECETAGGTSAVVFWDALFQQAAAEGISIFVSSGDSGASGCDASFQRPPLSPLANSPNYICSSSYATCVGGTQFNDTSNPIAYWSSTNGAGLGSALGYIPEGAWNEPLGGNSVPQPASSGGGVSLYIPTPNWQTGSGVPAERSGRYMPDISFSSSNHNGYFACQAASKASCVAAADGSYRFISFGGTSASAPSMAGVAALLNQAKGGAQGNLNPEIYRLAARAPAVFHDTTVATSGVSNCSVSVPSMCNNSVPSSTGLTGGQAGYLITAGYDEATGLGSLDVQAFLNSYTGVPAPSVTLTAANLTVIPGATTGNSSTVTVTPIGGFTGNVALSAAISSSPAGAQFLPSLSFGNTSPVDITGASAKAAALTVSTTAATTARLYPSRRREVPWYAGGGAAIACILLFGIPRRRRWRSLLGTIAFVVALCGGVLSCGGGNGSIGGSGDGGSPGTTAGTYVITVTGTSGTITTTSVLNLVVE